MIINKLWKDYKEEFVAGLVYGLVFGLVFGLVYGLVFGLVVILVNFSEALPFLTGFKEILFLILVIIVLTELVFFLDKSKPKKKENKLIFTLKRKAEALFEILLGLSLITSIYILFREIDFTKYLPEILKWIGYIGAGLFVITSICLGFYIWIKLNSLKYSK